MLHASNYERRKARQSTVRQNAEGIIEALANGESRVVIAKRLDVQPSDIIPFERKAERLAAKDRPKGQARSELRPVSDDERKAMARARKERKRARARARYQEELDARRTTRGTRQRLAVAVIEDLRSTMGTYAEVGARHKISGTVVGHIARAAGMVRVTHIDDDAYLAAVAELSGVEIPLKAGLVAHMLGVSYQHARRRLKKLGVEIAEICSTCLDPACSSELCGALTASDANSVHMWSVYKAAMSRHARPIGSRPDAQRFQRGDDEPGQG